METAYIGLGTNLGERLDNLQNALEALNLLPETRLLAVSSVYETDPVGYLEQQDFYNIVLKLETALSPQALLGSCLGIEAALGRVRTRKDGPRVIDLDLLLYGTVTMDTPELVLPHPRMKERGFVMIPLHELCPEIPALPDQGVRRTPHALTLAF